MVPLMFPGNCWSGCCSSGALAVGASGKGLVTCRRGRALLRLSHRRERAKQEAQAQASQACKANPRASGGSVQGFAAHICVVGIHDYSLGLPFFFH